MELVNDYLFFRSLEVEIEAKTKTISSRKGLEMENETVDFVFETIKTVIISKTIIRIVIMMIENPFSVHILFY